MKLSNIKLNPNNPRFIKDDKFKALVGSLKRHPEYLTTHKIAYKNGVIYGGNMRYRALLELGYTEVPDEWVIDVSDWSDESIREYIVVDNIPYGEHDFDLLSEQYEKEELEGWGMDVDKWGDIDFENIKSNEDRETNDKKQSVTCPDCGKTFEV